MLNQTVLVGCIADDIIINKIDNKEVCKLCLAVPRPYKNINGEYDTDFLDCILWHPIAKNVIDYCKTGDLVGIKGRLESNLKDVNGVKVKTIELIAERVTFLSSKKTDVI